MNKTLTGMILIVIGAVLLMIGIRGYQKQEEIFRAGDFLSASTTTTKTIPALKYVGSGFIGAGAILVIMGFSKRK